jgi:hypothetical protein
MEILINFLKITDLEKHFSKLRKNEEYDVILHSSGVHQGSSKTSVDSY